MLFSFMGDLQVPAVNLPGCKFLNPVLLGKMSLSPKMFMTNPLGVDPNKTLAPKFQIKTPAPQSWLLRIIPGRTDT